MKGDKLIIDDEHRHAARGIMDMVYPDVVESADTFIITIAGESGSGKSEIASVLADLLSEKDCKSIILQQDDYFKYPPKTNAEMRERNLEHVGMSEVSLDLLDRNCNEINNRLSEIKKPLVVFEEDRITEETIDLEGIKVAIVEGTYTTCLKNVHKRIFIDRTYTDTKGARERRARERQDDLLEAILEIEHGIISSQKRLADIIVTKNYEVITDGGSRRG